MNIGQASKASGVSERMIRHYEKIGLVPRALRRDSGYRDYSDADVNRLRFIANARDLGFPIEEIGTLLALWSSTHRASSEVKALALARAEELDRKARRSKPCACPCSTWPTPATGTIAPIARSSRASRMATPISPAAPMRAGPRTPSASELAEQTTVFRKIWSV